MERVNGNDFENKVDSKEPTPTKEPITNPNQTFDIPVTKRMLSDVELAFLKTFLESQEQLYIEEDEEILSEEEYMDLYGDDDDDFQTEVVLTPHQITDFLNQYVIGQDHAKKALSVAIYNHAKRLNDNTGLIRKSNILMAGASGTGKTLLAQTLAKVLNVPFAIADATSLTEAGYVGDDVENCLTRLVQAADNDIERAERGIIYIDEIDKIARKSENPSITRDVSGEGVQQALLKIIEGAEVSIPAGGGRKHPMASNAIINTKNILFICGGAFEGMLDTKNEGLKRSIGFNQEETTEKPIEKKLSTETLTKFGILPELIGRLPVLVQLDDIKKDDLVRILTEPKNALVKEYQALLRADGVTLEFTKEALEKIAEKAIERKTGARGLRGIMEELMLDIMYDIPSTPEITKCIITDESVETGIPVLIKNAA